MIQGELFELVNAEVERFGGLSEKFVGDAVLAVFGVPLAHDDDAERAVRAALAVRDAFPAFAADVKTRHAAAVGLRIGVNTGEVVAGREAASRGELMVSGDTVNVAARLQQRAERGQVLVGERTQAATRRSIRYTDLGAAPAKGKERRSRRGRRRGRRAARCARHRGPRRGDDRQGGGVGRPPCAHGAGRARADAAARDDLRTRRRRQDPPAHGVRVAAARTRTSSRVAASRTARASRTGRSARPRRATRGSSTATPPMPPC